MILHWAVCTDKYMEWAFFFGFSLQPAILLMGIFSWLHALFWMLHNQITFKGHCFGGNLVLRLKAGSWRDGSVVVNLRNLQKAGVQFPVAIWCSQLPVPPVPGNPTLSEVLHGLCHACGAHKLSQAHTHKKLIKEHINKSWNNISNWVRCVDIQAALPILNGLFICSSKHIYFGESKWWTISWNFGKLCHLLVINTILWTYIKAGDNTYNFTWAVEMGLYVPLRT